jgi:hypothetical protein
VAVGFDSQGSSVNPRGLRNIETEVNAVTCGRDYTGQLRDLTKVKDLPEPQRPLLGGRQGSVPIRRYLLALLPEGTGFASVPIASVAGGKPGDPSRKLMHRLRPSPTEMLKQNLNLKLAK